MKGSFFIILLFYFGGYNAIAQVELADYMLVVVDFTETNQNIEAVKLCDKLEKSYPENPDIYYLRGVNRYLLKDYDEAIRDFDKTLELKPDYSDAYLYRAKARKESKDYFGAMKDYNKAKDQNFSQTITSLAVDMIRSIFSRKD